MVTPLWQLCVSSQHMVKSLTLNPYMNLCNLILCSHIWSTNFNFRPPLTLDFLVRLSLNFHPMGEFGGVDWASYIFFVMDGQKHNYLSHTSRALLQGGVTKNLLTFFSCGLSLLGCIRPWCPRRCSNGSDGIYGSLATDSKSVAFYTVSTQ